MTTKNQKVNWLLKLSILPAICFALFSFKSFLPADALCQQLGIDQSKADQSIANSFLNGYLEYYSARNFKNIATGNRAAIATDLCTYSKATVNSDAFKNQYKAIREQMKPREPKAARTAEEVRESYLSSLRDAIKNSEETAKSFTGDMKKTIDESIADIKKQLKEAEKPDNEMIKMMIDGENFSHSAAVVEYERNLEEWNKNYPAESSKFIKKRLQQFMDITKDVDFNAQLVSRNGKKHFVDSYYERQPAQWKQAFRAGKEATQATRTFVSAWIKEIN